MAEWSCVHYAPAPSLALPPSLREISGTLPLDPWSHSNPIMWDSPAHHPQRETRLSTNIQCPSITSKNMNSPILTAATTKEQNQVGRVRLPRVAKKLGSYIYWWALETGNIWLFLRKQSNHDWPPSHNLREIRTSWHETTVHKCWLQC